MLTYMDTYYEIINNDKINVVYKIHIQELNNL